MEKQRSRHRLRRRAAVIAGGLVVTLGMLFADPATADTIILEPWSKANATNWETGWQAPADSVYAGEYPRTQTLMYQLADNAYKTGDDLKTALKADGWELTGSRNGTVGDNSFTVQATKGKNVVANAMVFRGVDDFMSVFGSFLGEPNIRTAADGNQYTVHQAYFYAADQAITAMKPAIASSCEGTAKVPLYLTGHNLGGAAAEIAAMLLAQQGCRVLGVTSLGAPRPGLENFQQEYARVAVDGVSLNDRTSRWSAAHDPVPCLMPGSYWKQVGHSHYIGADGKVQLNKEVNTCDTSEGFFKTVKDIASEVVDWAAMSGFFRIANWLQAILAWLANKIDLAADCSTTKFEGKRLGWWLGCRIVDLNQVTEFHTMDFNELFDSMLAALTSVNNKLSYLQNINQGVWEAPQWTLMHITVPKFEGETLPTYVHDVLSTQLCSTVDDPDGKTQSCDIQVPIGRSVALNFEGAIGNYVVRNGGTIYTEVSPGHNCTWADRPDFILDQCQIQIGEAAPYQMKVFWQPSPS